MSTRWMPLGRRAVVARGVSGTARGGPRGHMRRVRLEGLEDRTLLSGSVFLPTFMPYVPAGSSAPAQSATPTGFTPQQVRQAYGFNAITVGGIVGNGAGQTIAIVDAYDWPTAYADLHAFDVQFGLPDPPSFTKLNQSGQAGPLPSPDVPGGWGGEEALDVEWSHSVAPLAKIILVEANDASNANLLTAVGTAKNLSGVSVVSMSWGGPEDPTNLSNNSVFTSTPGHPVTFLASTGDTAAPGGYPAFSPNVVAVGGTSLFLDANNNYQSESGWSGSGGGTSLYEPKPVYQSALPYPMRSIPDVAAIADPNTGVPVYSSYDFGASTPWEQVGGTSLACPVWAAFLSIVDQERVAAGDGILDGPTQTLPMLYALPAADFHDVTTGNNGFPAGPGYDQVTGLGSMNAPRMAIDMAPLRIVVTPSQVANAVEGNPLTNVPVATFTDATGVYPASDYSATINWGDGAPLTTGTVVATSGGFTVDASHTYQLYGTYTISVTVTSTQGLSGQSSLPVIVADAPLTPSPTTISSVEGQKFTGVVGSFTDGNPLATTSQFTTVSINWGNGNTSPGQLVALGNGVFNVTGTNQYQQAGTYFPVITILDAGGQSTTINSTANVADAPLTFTAATVRSIAGLTFTSSIGSFVDAGPAEPAFDYSFTVDWGDGSSSTQATGDVTLVNRGTRWDLVGTHTYTRFGNYTIAVQIQDIGGAVAPPNPDNSVPSSTAIIADAVISSSASTFTVTQGTAYTALVGGFTSNNTYALAADFSQTTINWGDGTPGNPDITPALIAANGNGVFGVSGNHVYTTPGIYTTTINVVSAGGSTSTAVGSATVLFAPLSAVGNPSLSVQAGQVLTNTIATFTDTYAGASLANFTASINWGDGAVTSGLITQPGGQGTTFVVTGTHAWAVPQAYAATVSIAESGVARGTATSTVTVTDAPINVAGISVSPIFEGQAYSGTVAVFSTPNVLATPGGYVAQINWGDGTQTGGLITATGPGTFSVGALTPHSYGVTGNYVITIGVTSLGGNQASGVTSINVNPAPIVPTPGNVIQSVAGQTFTGIVGSFSQYPLTPVTDFTASINWGDGDISPGTVTAGTNGTFVVSGTETFANAGNFAVTVTILNTGDPNPGTFSIPAVIADAATTASGVSFSTVVGQAFSGQVASFTNANQYAMASQFVASIEWGDGTASTGVVGGSGGNFVVTGTHVYAQAGTDLPITVTIDHQLPGGLTGTSAIATGTARVLAPLTGGLSPLSDTGVSNTDGVTNNNTPTFIGTGQPDATVKIYAAPTSNPTAYALIGTGTISSSGSWSIQSNPLGDGSYQTIAAMIDPATNSVAQGLLLTPRPLTIVTVGPTIAGVSLNARTGILSIAFQPGLGGFDVAGLVNRGNYVLGLPNNQGVVQNFASTGITFASGPNGQLIANLSYNLGGARFKTGGYVVTVHAAGITDLAGNSLIERHFVTFPQATNYPDPDYVAQLSVGSNGLSASPQIYVSRAEQLAAAAYSSYVQGHKVVRVPNSSVVTISGSAVPRVSRFRKR